MISGYVRGILEGDGSEGYVTDAKGGKIRLPRGSSDAALTPYHVDRSKLFVMERIGGSKLVDASRNARAIEFTRFLHRLSRKTQRTRKVCWCALPISSTARRTTRART
jgi:hypothetical protein